MHLQREIRRGLCRTIQLTDTGIHPGSGVGNSRKEVSEDTIGMPVIAIGIPTVVDGPVLIADAIDSMFSYIASKIDEEGQSFITIFRHTLVAY